MTCAAHPVLLETIRPWRDLYRAEMNCQIVHDSLHPREGWTKEYLLEANGAKAGYGSAVVLGPWRDTRTIFEFYVLPQFSDRAFALFDALVAASDATGMTVQTNDALLTVMMHGYGRNIETEKIIFADGQTTKYTMDGVELRRREEPDGEWVLELDGQIVANGNTLYHYNRPYGDIYMSVEEAHRRRGLGTFLVQELKRICYEGGSVPCARCNPDNIASRQTLQKAGFTPVANILNGTL